MQIRSQQVEPMKNSGDGVAGDSCYSTRWAWM